jgi:uncharacterized membrane protein
MSTIETPALPAGEDLKLILPGKRVPFGAGAAWVGDGWRLFMKAPLMWIVSVLVLIVIAVIAGIVPILGNIAFQLLSPVFAAGFVVAARSVERGGDFELEHLFAGFKTRFMPLFIVGVIFTVAAVVILLVCAAFMGFSVFTAMMAGDSEQAAAAVAASLLTIAAGLLVMTALLVPLTMLYWFAPALVMMHDVPPWEAMKASFGACLRNFLPFLLYGLVMGALSLLAIITFGLGFLVWVPLAITSTYASYRQIFTEGGEPAVSF